MSASDYLSYNVNYDSIEPLAREDRAWCQQQIEHPSAQIIIVFERSLLLEKKEEGGYQLPTVTLAYHESYKPYLSVLSYQERPILAFNLFSFFQQQHPNTTLTPSLEDETLWTWLNKHLIDIDTDKQITSSTALSFVALRQCFTKLNQHELSLASLASGLLSWHKSVRFCGACGESQVLKRGGFVASCPHCSTLIFPRINPAVIMLVENNSGEEKKCLLAHHPRLPDNQFSTIAGFIDIGESIEHAVAREVREEVGLEVKDVHYVASQSWTVSSSLMLGFIATAEDWDFSIDEQELEYARWFSIDELKQFGQSSTPYEHFSMSTKDSIAYYLIQYWLQKNDEK